MGKAVIVYSTPLCAPCEALKSYLRSKEVPFIVKDVMIDEKAAAHLESKNVRSTPALEIDGLLLAGNELKTSRIEEILGIA